MRFFYNIAGIAVKGETPYDLIIQEESIPFLLEEPERTCGGHIQEKNCREMSDEVEVEFCRQPQIHTPDKGGVLKMNRLYFREGDEDKVCFYAAVNTCPYAIVTRKRGRICIAYAEESIPYMNYSHNLIDLFSPEMLLLEHRGLIIHASFIRWKNQGILFSGPSGMGKSTQADLWTKYEQAECLNGDRTALRKIDGTWMAYGLPYAGTSGIYRNESARLSAIVILRQGNENTVFRMKPAEAFRLIYAEVMIHHWNEGFVEKAADYITELVSDIPFYLLTCRPDRGAVDILRKELTGEIS